MNQEKNNKTPEKKYGSNLAIKRMGAAALILFAVAGVVGADAYANRAPQFSETKTEYVVEPGDGVDSASKHVEGVDAVDIRRVTDYIKADPANNEVFKDNHLDPGETLVIPESVKR
jgi:hypothetical protein